MESDDKTVAETPSPPSSLSDEPTACCSGPCATKREQELTSSLAVWMQSKNVPECMRNLIYWRCWKKSAVVFFGLLTTLVALCSYNIVCVASLYGLLFLVVAISFRIGYSALHAVQKTDAQHPFKSLLDCRCEYTKEQFEAYAENIRYYVNRALTLVRHYFLVVDLVDSIKMVGILWVVYYISGYLDLITLALFDVVLLFTVPKLYEDHQSRVDENLRLVHEKLCGWTTKAKTTILSKLNFSKNKGE